MPITRITKVGAFTDDVARQINANFALLAAQAGITVVGATHEEVQLAKAEAASEQAASQEAPKKEP